MPLQSEEKYQAALFFLRQKNFHEAKKHLMSARERMSENASFFQTLGQVEKQRQNPKAAEEAFLKSLSLNQQNPACQFQLANLYLTSQRPRLAIEAYEKTLALAPDSRAAAQNLAWLLATHQDAEVRDGQRSLELAAGLVEQDAGTNSTTLTILAAAYAEENNFPAALQVAQRGLAIAQKGNNSKAEELSRSAQCQ
jgi:tetratricopeptide (TPR) repeat protein